MTWSTVEKTSLDSVVYSLILFWYPTEVHNLQCRGWHSFLFTMFSWAPEVHIMHFETLIFFLWTPTLSICACKKCRELILQTVELTEVYSSVSDPSQTSCQRPNAAMQRVIMPDRGRRFSPRAFRDLSDTRGRCPHVHMWRVQPEHFFHTERKLLRGCTSIH